MNRPLFRSISLKKYALLAWMPLILTVQACAQQSIVPIVHQNIEVSEGKAYIEADGTRFEEFTPTNRLGLSHMKGTFTGTETGLTVDFGQPTLSGTMYYGFIPYGDSRHPMPVYFKAPAKIVEGKTEIIITDELDGRYDMVKWEEKGIGTFGYRVVNEAGTLLYDGKITFTGKGPFQVVPTVIEGPFVCKVGPDSAVIAFVTQLPVQASVLIGGQTFSDSRAETHHEITVKHLAPNSEHAYLLQVGEWNATFSLRTAPQPGTRQAFTFAYASDSRKGQGGGERNLYGANFYIMKKVMALAMQQNAAFFQFTGDMINGYLNDADEMNLEYANWKRAVEPFGHYIPVYLTMGNHEAFMRSFVDEKGRKIDVNRYPYETESGEYIFSQNFTMPTNGPMSEDGQAYDPDPDKQNFPSYQENVFWYRHGNVAVVVLNSNYWYTPTTPAIPLIGGNPHAYLMDAQIQWLEQTLSAMESDPTLDHIFVTQHTPAFPNGGHVRDDMWYGGNNDVRPWIAGKPAKFGIIERRDTYLDLLINQSSKVRAILTGDEHNYARTEIGPGMNIYPESWILPKLDMRRTIWQINNGAAGAPYYAQEQTPWSERVQGFTTQNAVVFFDVDGERIVVRVLNPDTLEEVDSMVLR